MPAQSAEGLRLRVSVSDRVARGSGQVRVELSCENRGPAVVTWPKPMVRVLWGEFDTPWRRRSCRDVPLPAEWERVAPGQTVRAVVEIEAPNVAGDYSVFASFWADGSSGHGGHSDSRLLRVR
jgi:hypothetical protein